MVVVGEADCPGRGHPHRDHVVGVPGGPRHVGARVHHLPGGAIDPATGKVDVLAAPRAEVIPARILMLPDREQGLGLKRKAVDRPAVGGVLGEEECRAVEHHVGQRRKNALTRGRIDRQGNQCGEEPGGATHGFKATNRGRQGQKLVPPGASAAKPQVTRQTATKSELLRRIERRRFRRIGLS